MCNKTIVYYIISTLDTIIINNLTIARLISRELCVSHAYRLSTNHINSSPSYFKSSIFVSSISTWLLVLNAEIYVAVFPSNSVVFKATMASSFVPGINLNEENPCFGCSFVICNFRTFWLFAVEQNNCLSILRRRQQETPYAILKPIDTIWNGYLNYWIPLRLCQPNLVNFFNKATIFNRF